MRRLVQCDEPRTHRNPYILAQQMWCSLSKAGRTPLAARSLHAPQPPCLDRMVYRDRGVGSLDPEDQMATLCHEELVLHVSQADGGPTPVLHSIFQPSSSVAEGFWDRGFRWGGGRYVFRKVKESPGTRLACVRINRRWLGGLLTVVGGQQTFVGGQPLGVGAPNIMAQNSCLRENESREHVLSFFPFLRRMVSLPGYGIIFGFNQPTLSTALCFEEGEKKYLSFVDKSVLFIVGLQSPPAHPVGPGMGPLRIFYLQYLQVFANCGFWWVYMCTAMRTCFLLSVVHAGAPTTLSKEFLINRL